MPEGDDISFAEISLTKRQNDLSAADQIQAFSSAPLETSDLEHSPLYIRLIAAIIDCTAQPSS